VQLRAVLGGEGHVGQHVVLAVVHERGELWPAPPDLIGDVAPGGAGLLAVGLTNRLLKNSTLDAFPGT